MIRPRGIALTILAIVLLVLAGSTRVGWLLLFDAVLWGTIVTSAITPWFSTGGLQLRRRPVAWGGRRDEPGPMEGDVVEFDIRLRNRGLLPCMFVTVRYNLAGEPVEHARQRLFATWIGRGQSLSATSSVRYDQRGLHRLPAGRVESSIPFGLFRRSRRLGGPAEVVVLPRVYPVPRLRMRGAVGDRDSRPTLARVGEQSVGSREFAPGDSWRLIHWRNSARTAKPQTREFERFPDDTLVIAFEAGEERPKSDDALEHSIRVAASVGDSICRSGGPVRLLAGGLREETSDRHRLLNRLALLERSGRSSLPLLLRDRPLLSDVLAIVEDIDGEGIEALIGLARSRTPVTAVVLSGFQSERPSGDPVGDLRRSGAYAVECRPGCIAEALALLGSGPHMGETP